MDTCICTKLIKTSLIQILINHKLFNGNIEPSVNILSRFEDNYTPPAKV